ncbi:MAG TPA: XcyI family restriction endonuclease [Pirellulales bacterium]|nr:XcyI family restriction endonuclease [Pirellulales bacterium]
MGKADFHQQLLASDEFARCSLRATFFVRRLRGLRLWEAIQEVQRLVAVSSGFVWDERGAWGIETVAWDYVANRQMNPLLIFCHPRVISEQPRLLLYYRTLALLSQKGLKSLVGADVARLEAGKTERLDPEWLKKLVLAINSILSAMIVGSADIEPRDLAGFQFASAGSTIQGSWNNSVGSEGEAAVKTILLNWLRAEIAQIVWRDNTSVAYTEDSHAALIDRIAEIRVVRLKQGYHLIFSNEPDISLRDPSDLPVLAIEVKAGTDPAGALERLGAAMKSFENDRNLNPRVQTVYVVRCMTPELRKRISQGGFFDQTFGLSELLSDQRSQQTFANLVLRSVLGKKRR